MTEATGSKRDRARDYALEDFTYYTRSLRHARWATYLLDFLTIGSTAATTALATLQAPPLATAAIGLLSVVSTTGKKAWNPEAQRLSVAQARTDIEQLIREYDTEWDDKQDKLLVEELGKVKRAELGRFIAQRTEAGRQEASER